FPLSPRVVTITSGQDEGGSKREERECPQGGRRTTARRRTKEKADGRPEVLRGLRRAEKTSAKKAIK
ncbi:hypothetical protein AAVH_18354, partial [Aphelenchoides avenae]